jgi:hypothetical protein
MAEDIYLVGYGFLRGFIGGVLSRFGVIVSDMTLDILSIVLGYYLKTQPGWKGVIGKVLYIGGLVSIGLEIGQNTGRSIANELFGSLRIGAQATGAQAMRPSGVRTVASSITGRQIRV